MKLSLRSRQLLKFIHVLLSSFWIATIACVLLLVTLTSYSSSSLNHIYILSVAVKRIITFITIPSVIGSYITGNIIAKSANYEKYLWVRIKRPLTAVTFLIACLYLRVLISGIVSVMQTNNSSVLSELKYNSDKRTIIILCVIQLIVAVFMFLISYLKPWMKRVKQMM